MATRSRKKPTESAHSARLNRLAAEARRQGLDAFLVTNPRDVAYLTGFLGGDSYLLLSTNGRQRKPLIISDFRYEEELRPVKPIADIAIRRKPMGDEVAARLPERGRVGIQGEQMSVAEHSSFAKRVGSRRVVPTIGVVAGLRRIKDADEIRLIRSAIKTQEEALAAILAEVRPGQTELEVAARLEAEMKARGSREPGFATIVAAGASGSLPHYRPGPVRLKANAPLLIDWGAVYEGYHGDMTRTFALGRWPAKMREIYGIVLDAHEAAAAALRPGASSKSIDAIARALITRAGYGPRFGHGLGHGLGLNGHEDPRLHFMAGDSALQPGNVVTIEPGIYLPGVGGVRIEDDYLITEDGAVNLCSLPRDREWATL